MKIEIETSPAPAAIQLIRNGLRQHNENDSRVDEDIPFFMRKSLNQSGEHNE